MYIKTISYEHFFANGAVGVKVWKNIGMYEKTSLPHVFSP